MKKVPFGKFIFSNQESLVKAAEIVRECIDFRLARWSYSDSLIHMLEADGSEETVDPTTSPVSVPAGELTLWIDDFALPIHNSVCSQEVSGALGELGVVFSPSEVFLDISKKTGFKVNLAMKQATPVHPLLAKRMVSRGEKVGTLFLTAQGESFESFALGNEGYDLESITTIWGVANKPFQELLDDLGLNQSKCSRQFGIPLRTVQDWAGGRREPPQYIRLMMAEAVGLLDIR